ncbi:signal transduction histidine kinase [Nakamurella sp. UYEF19]|uniref:sensor histidine kinase n=1 Tax=Nakamurella sp. UYEF19 TaxID=1756392 RepID=UPI003392FBA5
MTAVFVAAGIALLTVVYFLVSGLFDQAIRSSTLPAAAGYTTTLTGGAATGLGPSVVAVRGQAGPASSGQAAPLQVVPAWVLDQPGMTMTAGGTLDVSQTSSAATAIAVWHTGESQVLAGDVLTGLLIWSGLALVVFALFAAAASWWLVRRSLRRIGEVTAMAKDLSRSDLHRRLDLTGPADEIKDLADTIDAMLNRLEAAFAGQDRFVANASHELRTPLTTARTALEIPLAQGRVPADLQPAFRTALRAGERSERLISSLLTLARGDDGDLGLVDLAEVVARAAAEFGIETGNLCCAEVIGDATMVEQAVGNLLDNAVRHNPDGGPIAINLAADEDEIRLIVSNPGIDLTNEQVALLAEPFYRGEDSRREREPGRGVGLGLSIVQRVAQAQHGRLQLRARDGGGLVATLVLPTAREFLVDDSLVAADLASSGALKALRTAAPAVPEQFPEGPTRKAAGARISA